MKKICFLLYSVLCVVTSATAQQFTHADSLRGSYGSSRNWWDVTKYDLHVKFNLQDSSISGYNDMQFKILHKGEIMQIDLQEPLLLDSICHFERQNLRRSKKVSFKKDGNAYFIPAMHSANKTIEYLRIYFHGKPTVAVNPPWLPGGVIWKTDKLHRPWITVACQGQGASVWYPCKDHQADEPDSAEMHITCPDTLVCIGNGRLRGTKNNGDGTATYDWAVVNPINNYCLIPYIGKYVNFNERYSGKKGPLDMSYWVLDYNLEKAKKQFKDASRMMEAFEYWFGPYPFYEDGYKLVDAPHLGMEHQSATAYGNGYKNGYAGKDLSGTGWGLKWDFIIVHESGHEWFGNNITTKDIADMWVHEGFTCYSESLFIEYFYGKEAGKEYLVGDRKSIENKFPMISSYGVNNDPAAKTSDIYYKGASMIHMIRKIINDDEKFRGILRGLNKDFYHQTVTSDQVEHYISSRSRIDFSSLFNQYLRTVMIPRLEYRIHNGKVDYKWVNCIPGFHMPVKVMLDKKTFSFIYPTDKSIKESNIVGTDLKIDDNFYIDSKKLEDQK